MADKTDPAPAQAPAPNMVSISDQQAREALGAVLEVLGGAPVTRVLELAEKIGLAKRLLSGIVTGEFGIGNAQRPTMLGTTMGQPERRPAGPAPAIPERMAPRTKKTGR